MKSPFKITVVEDGLIIQSDDEVFRIIMDQEEMMTLSTNIIMAITSKGRDAVKPNGACNG